LPGQDGIHTLASGTAAPISLFGVGFRRRLLSAVMVGGWHHWGGFDWHNHYAIYDHNRYYSHSRTFYNRNAFYRGGGDRGRGFSIGLVEAITAGASIGPAQAPGLSNGDHQAARGYAQPHGQSGVHSGAFSGYDHGGQTRGFSARGNSSLGGGGISWRWRWWISWAVGGGSHGGGHH